MLVHPGEAQWVVSWSLYQTRPLRYPWGGDRGSGTGMGVEVGTGLGRGVEEQGVGRGRRGRGRGRRLAHLVRHLKPAQQGHHFLLEVLLLQDSGQPASHGGPLGRAARSHGLQRGPRTLNNDRRHGRFKPRLGSRPGGPGPGDQRGRGPTPQLSQKPWGKCLGHPPPQDLGVARVAGAQWRAQLHLLPVPPWAAGL